MHKFFCFLEVVETTSDFLKKKGSTRKLIRGTTF